MEKEKGYFRPLTIYEFAQLQPGDTIYACWGDGMATKYTVKSYPVVRRSKNLGIHYYVKTNTFNITMFDALKRMEIDADEEDNE